jgi:hypothetical protein
MEGGTMTPQPPVPMLTDEECDGLRVHVVTNYRKLPATSWPEREVERELIRAAFALGWQRRGAEDLDWIRSEARDCGCSDRIAAAIERGGEEVMK